MVSVFLGFVVAEDAATKMFGLGLATAIFIDATLVRMVLVPAAMKLIGKANWWTPAWLNRLLPAIHGEWETRRPAPELAADLPAIQVLAAPRN
jgi:RND superfamily putative drug exporter